jgi:glycosyltransferase involved in cell wall biosynthesis
MFSVIIPLYNKEHTIEGTLCTVLNQTYKEFEIVIVNDGSTDNGVQIIKDYTTDSRIRIIEQNNQGVSVARNTGVHNAKYDYIAFLDGDDEWLPEYLSKMNEAIELFRGSEMFCSAGIGRNANGVTNKRQIDKYANKVVAFNFFENPHVFLHIGATVVTKQLFNKANGFPIGMKRNEDFAFLYSAALFTQPIYSGFPLSVYVGGVEGQATRESIYENQNLLNDTVNRYNLVYKNWIKSGAKNTLFIVFMKYELRHFFMINIYNSEFSTNFYCLNNLDPGILNYFNYLDKNILKTSRLKKTSILYFKLTKLKWLINGYQRVK